MIRAQEKRVLGLSGSFRLWSGPSLSPAELYSYSDFEPGQEVQKSWASGFAGDSFLG